MTLREEIVALSESSWYAETRKIAAVIGNIKQLEKQAKKKYGMMWLPDYDNDDDPDITDAELKKMAKEWVEDACENFDRVFDDRYYDEDHPKKGEQTAEYKKCKEKAEKLTQAQKDACAKLVFKVYKLSKSIS